MYICIHSFCIHWSSRENTVCLGLGPHRAMRSSLVSAPKADGRVLTPNHMNGEKDEFLVFYGLFMDCLWIFMDFYGLFLVFWGSQALGSWISNWRVEQRYFQISLCHTGWQHALWCCSLGSILVGVVAIGPLLCSWSLHWCPIVRHLAQNTKRQASGTRKHCIVWEKST